MVSNCVHLYHFGSWYKAYREDAKIVSVIMDYKLFQDGKSGNECVGFPEAVLDKVLDALAYYKVNYILPYDENKLKDYGENNAYLDFCNGEVPLSYIRNKIPIYEGAFIIRFNDEENSEFIIGKNIKSEARLVEFVYKNEIGKEYDYNEEKLFIIEKNIVLK